MVVTLFHYRCYGSDVAQVLIGLVIPPESYGEFERFRVSLGYPNTEETDNPIYQHFLR
jgi:threonine dehydratase